MNFLKVGAEIINLDLVTSIRFAETKDDPNGFAIWVYYGEARSLFNGSQARALEKYLNQHSLDLIQELKEVRKMLEDVMRETTESGIFEN